MLPRHQRVAPNTAASTSQRSVPFPTQRSFGLPRQPQGLQVIRVLEEQAAVRALQWRQRSIHQSIDTCPYARGSMVGWKDAVCSWRCFNSCFYMLVCSIYSRNLLARPFDIKKSSSVTKVRRLTQVVTAVSERDPILTYS